MAFVKLYTDDADAQARQSHERIERALGFVPETYQAMGRSGAFLNAALNLEKAAGANLEERTRQLIAVAVSAANGCGYCLHAHRAMALGAGCSDDEVTGALEMAAMMSAVNTFNKAIGLTHDVTPEALVRASDATA